ncbi:uncharacterized protein LOC111629152 [Centruroides sculpturatus]|uniref:uncharacterized protein LOC111629152 n=1 Tax=Centruroides sculpturatus TaxID=218467 RepID=UPI000C6EF808|nr:uncharacterized protein LOC111629152 [Centruroides sculpturatus]
MLFIKIFILIAICTVYIQAQLADRLSRKYCSSGNQAALRFCAMENNAGIVLDIFRNCVLQFKKFYTLHEMSEYICNNINGEEFVRYKKCAEPALTSAAERDEKFLPILDNCLAVYND